MIMSGSTKGMLIFYSEVYTLHYRNVMTIKVCFSLSFKIMVLSVGSKHGYIAIATKRKTNYVVEKEHKHKFRLICINDDLYNSDTDSTWVNIYQCKGR